MPALAPRWLQASRTHVLPTLPCVLLRLQSRYSQSFMPESSSELESELSELKRLLRHERRATAQELGTAVRAGSRSARPMRSTHATGHMT